MKRVKETKTMGTMAGYIVRKLMDEKKGLENTIEYLRSAFLSSAVDALFNARRKAGLTQEQVAQKLGKKQESIARWEADIDGKMSLRQYFDLAIASGHVPLNIVLEPLESVRDFVIDHLEEQQTPDLYYLWLQNRFKPTIVAQPIIGTVTTQEDALPSINKLRDSTPTVRSVERFLRVGYEENLDQANYCLPQQWCEENITSTNANTSKHLAVKAQSLS